MIITHCRHYEVCFAQLSKHIINMYTYREVSNSVLLSICRLNSHVIFVGSKLQGWWNGWPSASVRAQVHTWTTTLSLYYYTGLYNNQMTHCILQQSVASLVFTWNILRGRLLDSRNKGLPTCQQLESAWPHASCHMLLKQSAHKIHYLWKDRCPPVSKPILDTWHFDPC